MTFLLPSALYLLVLIPVLIGVYLFLQHRRQQLIARYGSLGFAQSAQNRHSGLRRHIPPLFFLLAIAILLVALARPQTVMSLPRVEGTVILAFDVSGSMAADDMQPTRIDAAKAAARDFIGLQPRTVQVGIVAFSDSGLAVQVPTNDEATLLATIDRLAPQRGTSIANGILASLKAIDTANRQTTNYYSNRTPQPTPSPTPVPKGTYTPGVIILLSDGQNNENPDPMQAAQLAADRGVRIFTVGIGSLTGTNLHINGFTVHTQLDEAPLQQISELTDGVYYNAQNADELRKIYENINTQLIVRPEKTEVTSLFAGASILLLLIGGIFSLLWFGRLP